MKNILVGFNDNIILNFNKILEGLNLKDCDIYTNINDYEIYFKNNIYDNLDSSLEFSNINNLFLDEDYYVINLELQFYRKSDDISCFKCIKNKYDFLSNGCLLSIRVFDVYFLEIIAKECISNLIYSNISNYFTKDIEYISYNTIIN